MKRVTAIQWRKQDERHYLSEDGDYRLFKGYKWCLQHIKYNGGMTAVAIDSTLHGIQQKAERYAKQQAVKK